MASIVRNRGAVSEVIEQVGMAFTERLIFRYGPSR